ncbi:unnamed protein product [Rotaria sp. Silwood2]|nr:unnamed protein product [Rotaria sp. Silwood2]CAF4076312.1 unnamed protein product [Rotaria sp. Silwood2]CAF4241800.1 unnamed protein product [Rotaria sp. Silwood2]
MYPLRTSKRENENIAPEEDEYGNMQNRIQDLEAIVEQQQSDLSSVLSILNAKNKQLDELHKQLGELHLQAKMMKQFTASIYSLAFSPDSMFLAASSNTETIHIFRLANPKEKAPEEATWMGYFSRKLSDVAHYLPKQTSEVLTQDRSFAFVHLQSPGMKTTIAMNV